MERKRLEGRGLRRMYSKGEDLTKLEYLVMKLISFFQGLFKRQAGVRGVDCTGDSNNSGSDYIIYDISLAIKSMHRHCPQYIISDIESLCFHQKTYYQLVKHGLILRTRCADKFEDLNLLLGYKVDTYNDIGGNDILIRFKDGKQLHLKGAVRLWKNL